MRDNRFTPSKRGIGGEPGGVDRADRGSHHHVRLEAALGQSAQHTDLDRARLPPPAKTREAGEPHDGSQRYRGNFVRGLGIREPVGGNGQTEAVPNMEEQMAKVNLGRVLLAGLVGTAAMTMLMLGAPFMGMPKMPIGNMLGGFLHIGPAAGWAMHFVIGVTLAIIYAGWVAGHLPGGPALRGALYGTGVFLLAQLVVMPMMGAGVFSGGNVLMIGGSLMGHLVYGALVSLVYGGRTEALQLTPV